MPETSRRADSSAAAVLTARGLTKSFRGLHALENYELTLKRGEILGLIGPNGAGKTTALNLLTGFIRPTAGEIRLEGENITGLLPNEVARRGLVRTFQNIRLFASLTVLENVVTAAQLRSRKSLVGALCGLPGFYRSERDLRERAMAALAAVGLEKHAGDVAGSLPYGLQRRVEIARALATGPKVLLLDEPAAGMNPVEGQELAATIRGIRDREGVTIILVEHDMSVVMRLSDRIQVLNYGRIIAEGTAAEVRSNPQVIEAYLGGRASA